MNLIKNATAGTRLSRRAITVVAAVGVTGAAFAPITQAQPVDPSTIEVTQGLIGSGTTAVSGGCQPAGVGYAYTVDLQPFVVASGTQWTEVTSISIPHIEGAKVEFELVDITQPVTEETTFEEFKKWVLSTDPYFVRVWETEEEQQDTLEAAYESYRKQIESRGTERVSLNIPLAVEENNDASTEDVPRIGAGYGDVDGVTPVDYIREHASALESSRVVVKSNLYDEVTDSEGKHVSDYVDTYSVAIDKYLFDALLNDATAYTDRLVALAGSIGTATGESYFDAIKNQPNAEGLDDNPNLYEDIDFHGVDQSLIDEAAVMMALQKHFAQLQANKESIFEDPALENFSIYSVLTWQWGGFFDLELQPEQKQEILAQIQKAVDAMEPAEYTKRTAPFGITLRMKVVVPAATAKEQGDVPVYYQNSDFTSMKIAYNDGTTEYGEPKTALMSPFTSDPTSPIATKPLFDQVQSGEKTWAKVFETFSNPTAKGITDTDAEAGSLAHSLFDPTNSISVDHIISAANGTSYVVVEDDTSVSPPYGDRKNESGTTARTDYGGRYRIASDSDLRNMVLMPADEEVLAVDNPCQDPEPTPTPTSESPSVPAIIPIPVPVSSAPHPTTTTPTEVVKEQGRGLLAQTGVSSAVASLAGAGLLLLIAGAAVIAYRRRS